MCAPCTFTSALSPPFVRRCSQFSGRDLLWVLPGKPALAVRSQHPQVRSPPDSSIRERVCVHAFESKQVLPFPVRMVGKCVTPCLSAVQPSKAERPVSARPQNGRVSCGHGGRDGGQGAPVHECDELGKGQCFTPQLAVGYVDGPERTSGVAMTVQPKTSRWRFNPGHRRRCG